VTVARAGTGFRRPSWLPRGRSQRFLKAVSWRWRLVALGAIFFTFGTLGFVLDIWSVNELQPWRYVIASVVFAGLTASSYAAVLGVFRRFIPVAVAFQYAVPKFVLPRLAAAAPHASAAEITARLRADGWGVLACIMLGYFFFVRFISGEGARSLRLRTEVELAKRMHVALVPPVALSTPRFELFGRSEPSSEVGGDLLDVVERPGALVVAVADVSGHGVAAGSIMGMVKSAIRMRLLMSDALDALLDDLDAVVAQLGQPQTFVTFAGLRFDATDTAEAALAGHLPILHHRRAAGMLATIDNAYPPLGVIAAQGHATTRVAFAPGDTFAILTDGLTEVVDRRGEQLDVRGVAEEFGRHVHQPLPALYDALLSASRAHGPQLDDQTLLLVRIR